MSDFSQAERYSERNVAPQKPLPPSVTKISNAFILSVYSLIALLLHRNYYFDNLHSQ